MIGPRENSKTVSPLGILVQILLISLTSIWTKSQVRPDVLTADSATFGALILKAGNLRVGSLLTPSKLCMILMSTSIVTKELFGKLEYVIAEALLATLI